MRLKYKHCLINKAMKRLKMMHNILTKNKIVIDYQYFI